METIVDVIESFPQRTGIALVYDNGFRTFRYSYTDLYSLIRKCASFYAAQGVKPGERIAIWGPNRPEWAIAHLGAIYGGIVPVPIDMQATREAAENIVRHSDCRLLIRSQLKKPLAIGIPAVTLEDLEFEIARCREALPFEARADDMTQIVYTSGTTGDPKGVVLTHENIVANIDGILQHLHIDERDSILALLPFSHMLGQTGSLLAPLKAGMRVVMIGSLTASSMFKALAKERVTIILAVPRILQGLRAGIEAQLSETRTGRLVWALPRPLRAFIVGRKFGGHLRFFVSGGAALDADTAAFFKRLGLAVLAGYGLTETSPVLTLETEQVASGISGGIPLTGVELKIVDDEIRARGKSVFHEYFNDPAKTAAAFADGYFKTGDLGYFEDDRLFIKGRRKEMIVTAAGVNVYPDDIEPVLNAMPEVKESCIIGVAGEHGEEVHAVVIPATEDAGLAAIMRSANLKLNSSQQIQSISRWPEAEFPKTSTQKTKRALVQRIANVKDVHAPAGGTTSKLRAIIAQATGVEGGQITDDKKLYDDLHLDSIGRIELASLITQEYFFDFDEDHITNTTTVGDLERIIATRAKGVSRFNFPMWPHYSFMILARILGMELVTGSISRLFAHVRVNGKEHLRGLRGPVIFVANHVSYIDHSVIFRSLPLRYRYRIAAPAFAEFFHMPGSAPLPQRIWKRFAYYWGAATMALFPTSEVFSSKRALEHIGMLVERGESIVIFPEAERTQTSAMLPFRKGTAILVKNLRVPVVPIGHRGLEYIFPRGAALPKFGRAVVNIGKPIYVGKESIEEITARLEKEIEKLRSQ